MRRFRRRRRLGQWLMPNVHPYNISNTGSNASVGDQNAALTLFDDGFPVAINDSAGIIEVPLTIADQQNLVFGGAAVAVDTAFNAQNLADVQGFGYSLKRIVGQMYVLTAPAANAQALTPSIVAVCCGLIVRRVDPGTPDNSTGDLADHNPFILKSATDPWIWRRTWLFSPGNAGGDADPSSPAGSDNGSVFAGALQPSNTVFTGPNCTASIDAKTKRTIKAEERLFLNVAARSVFFNPAVDPGNVAISLGVYFDYRLFGRTFTTQGNRGRATR